MPVHGTMFTPVSSETRFMKRTSRPPNIAVGSTIVCTPWPLAALTASSAASDVEDDAPAAGAPSRPERGRLRRRAQRPPAPAVHEGRPRDRGLLADAGPGVVAHAGRERLLELLPLGVGERHAGVVGAPQRLELTLDDVRGQRLSGGGARV